MISGHGATRGRLLVALMLVGLIAQATSPAIGSDYPGARKVVTIIVPYPPGGPGDIMARAVAEGLRTQLNATFIIENKAGASQILATRAAARATPDGYTLLLGSATSMAINPSTRKSLPYDPLRDFEPISMVIKSPQYLITRPDFPANSLGELIDLAKRSPGKLTYASLGPGSTPHIAGELLNSLAGISITHVPYPGAAPAARDVAAGHVDMTYTTNVLNMIRSGQLKALGVTSATRATVAPDIPAIAESGMPDFDVGMWMGFAAPAGTPTAIINLLHDGIKKAVESGALKSRLGAAGEEYELTATTPAEFRKFIQAEVPRWRKVIDTAKLTVE
jgi:tripartite-type tricarboxylate transporter receptor subunit TctC